MKRTLLYVSMTLLVSIACAPAALASHVSCGDVLTQDTRLDSDLLDCPGDGVVIGAGGITLDLGGHTVDGVPGSGGDGVDNSGGYDGVEVRNGEISEFQSGVRNLGAHDGTVERVDFVRTTGVFLEQSDRNVIEHNTFSAGTGVIVFLGCDDTVIRANTISGPGTGVTLWGNLFADEVRRTLVEHNRLAGNGAGIVIVFQSVIDSDIRANEVSGTNGVGITAAGLNTRVERNTLTGNDVGIFASGFNVLVTRNRVASSDGDGIFVPSSSVARDVAIEGNVVNGNGDDGIDADDPDVSIARNTANSNADLGIEAVAGVTDGGGNKARGNGNPAQCLNVSCR